MLFRLMNNIKKLIDFKKFLNRIDFDCIYVRLILKNNSIRKERKHNYFDGLNKIIFRSVSS